MELRESLGLPIAFEEGQLQYNDNEVTIKTVQRYTEKDLEKIFRDKKTEKENKELYRVYKEVRKIEDKELWEEVCFDIIVIKPGKIGKEYVKTRGYYRTIAENGYRFPEILQIVEGYAEVLLQQPSEKHEKVKEAILVRMQKMEILAVSSNYGVTIINPSNKNAVIARIRAKEAKEITKDFEETRGGCYYGMEGGKWEFNENYEEIPNLRLEPPQNKWKSLKRGIPIYSIYTYKPRMFAPLLKPDPLDYLL